MDAFLDYIYPKVSNVTTARQSWVDEERLVCMFFVLSTRRHAAQATVVRLPIFNPGG